MNIAVATLRYVVATVELGSFSQAARSCGVSQPTVSNAVAQVEELLGGKLFARRTRNMSVTPFGQHLLPMIRSVLEGHDELVAAADEFRNPPEKLLRIGFSPIFRGEFLIRLLSPFVQVGGDAEIVYKECSIGDMENRLDNHRVDAVFTVGERKKASRRSVIFHTERLRYLPKGGLDAERQLKWGGGIPIEEAAEDIMVFTRGDCGLAPTTRNLFRQRALLPPEYRGEALSYSVLEEWAELGIGAAVLPESCLGSGASNYPLLLVDGAPAELEYHAVWNHDTLRPDHVTAFIRYLKHTLPKLASGGVAGQLG